MGFIYRIFVCFFVLLASTFVKADDTPNWLQLGQENLVSGHYREAENQLSQAEQQATTQKNTDKLILVHALQGYMALQWQQNTEAEQILSTALAQAKQNANQDLIVRIDLYLGQLYEHRKDQKQARYCFQQAVLNPEKVLDKSLLVSAFYQLANVAIKNHQPQEAWQQLQQAIILMQTLSVNPSNSQLWLNIGYQSLQLYSLSPQDNFLAAAFTHLNHALTLARQNQQPRIQAATLKHLASLYEQQQLDEAIKLLQEDITIAQKEDASDLLIDLEWKIGQLYQQQNKPDLAIAAYRQAVNHIDRIRIDIPVSYQNGRSSFRDTFMPIYLALADLLLRQSSTASVAQQQILLAEARDSIERMKKSELEDYFQSRCDISANVDVLQKIDPHAAAFYPILLPDRLEIIVYTADGLRRFTSQVTAKDLEQQARLFAENLRNYADFSQSKAQAQLLYHWLIAPVQAFLQQQHIETLIYIPDGVLRLVPLAALYDGKQFVIEQYAVATSAGMSMIDSSSMPHQNRMLLAGISIPGDVVSDLPDSVLNDLVVQTADQKQSSISGKAAESRELSIAEQQQKTRELRQLLRNPVIIEELKHLLSLPSIDSEIKQLAEQNHSSYLLNESFSLENFIHQLKQEPHDILHIASHGFFGGTAEDSFIMTHDKILTLNQLELLLGSDYFKRFPIDLLVLSACQTAEGDDRSPLGISGVAIKTKVHSALGSLWSVSDQATAELMAVFYQSLNSQHQTKAKALQEAMLTLLKQKDFANPSFWSPFILIGNWV
ncbi:MAG: CHAT domain-containing protein [Methylococcales bacterium]|nr:CHAT domain-containing protein [Methylococcales bacterium]